MGKDTYSHIHYDSEQARVISVREAARLQSFPDGFQFGWCHELCIRADRECSCSSPIVCAGRAYQRTSSYCGEPENRNTK